LKPVLCLIKSTHSEFLLKEIVRRSLSHNYVLIYVSARPTAYPESSEAKKVLEIPLRTLFCPAIIVESETEHCHFLF
jgi:hypothetical protein